MDSEFIKDLKSLQKAFQMHVDEKDDQRSIVVIANDGDRVFSFWYGKGTSLFASLLTVMTKPEHRDLMDKVVRQYEKDILSAGEKGLLIASSMMNLVMILWAIVLVALWFFPDLSAFTTLTNLLLLVYLFFSLFTSHLNPYGKKQGTGRIFQAIQMRRNENITAASSKV